MYQPSEESDKHRFPRIFKEYIKANYKKGKIHEQVAELPTHLVLSLSPDRILEEVFIDKELPFHFSYYHKKKEIGIDHTPSQVEPLLYNLFGDILGSHP